MSQFVHLHNHTHYSLLDSISTPKQLVQKALEYEQPGVALTDHGVMYGVYELFKLCQKDNIKPLMGFEAYVSNGTRFEKNRPMKLPNGKRVRNYFHLVLLAKDAIGYKNLIKLTTLGHTEGFYYRPRIDKELLEKHHEGVIATSACLGGVINAHLVDGNEELAYSEAQYYKDLFGDDFYLELQNHNLAHDALILDKVPKMAKELGIKLVATNDIHYIKKEHAVAHNVMLYIRDATAANAGQFDIYDLRYGEPEMYFKSTDEMKDLFSEYPESISNTLEIADKCNFGFEKKLYMPEFPIPSTSKASNLDEYLTELTWEGIEKRYPVITDEIKERTKFELDIIISMGFPGYFLIVWDFIRAARELGVRVGPGRGSAAGSIVAYALEITNVDPIPYDLLFERFLNPERVSMPDIDIDFADDKRDMVINYVKEKYGAEAVAMIITFGTLSTRAAITDIGRVLGVDLGTVRQITKAIPVVRGKVAPIADAIELADLKWLKDSKDQKHKELIDNALILEGKMRNTSTHAAGVVIAPGDLTQYVPLYQPAKSKGQSVELATQFSMNDLEDAGLLKMDFLGLRTLSIIENTLNMVKANHGLDIDIDYDIVINVDDTDPKQSEEQKAMAHKTWDLLSDGDTLAVFQFESGGMQEYLRQLKPHNLEELTAMNALYRPGPMENIPEFIDRKFGRNPITYLHKIMEKSLKPTYGIIVYQEQVMMLVQHIAGFSLGQADVLRRAMGKKKQALMDAQKPPFIEGAAKHGISEKLAMEIFQLIEKFASYGFNKSHALAYSYVAYQTAWLKANYPAEFLAANMTAEINAQDKVVLLIDEAKKFGITVLPPDVNRSYATFTAVNNEIFFGLAGIRNVGIPAIDSMVEARKEKKFTSFFDFVSRVDTRLINKRALEALVCAGAFDTITPNRASLMASIDTAIEYSKAVQGSQVQNMDSLFGENVESANIQEPPLLQVNEWQEKERLEREKEVLNFYVSGHPLNRFRAHCKEFSTINIIDASEEMDGNEVRVCGFIDEVQVKMTKNNKQFAILTVEDLTHKAEVMVWPNSFDKYRELLQKDNVIVISGKAEFQNDQLKIMANEIEDVEEVLKQSVDGYKIWIDLEKMNQDIIYQFKNEMCTTADAKSKLHLILYDKSKNYKKMYLAEDVQIPVNTEYTENLMKLFGDNFVGFKRKEG